MSRRTRRGLLIGAGVVAVLALLSIVASYFAAGPLQQAMLARLNQKLKGYHIEIGAVDLRPLSFSVDLRQVVLTQDAHPDPPLATVPQMGGSLSWRDLLRGRVVGQIALRDPKIFLSRTNIESEKKDPEPLKDHGWQDAVQAIMPVRVNTFAVDNAHVTYIDSPKSAPIEITRLNVRAHNIQNVIAQGEDYPSDVQVDGAGVGNAQIGFNGRANFLAKPFPAVRGDLTIQNLDIVRFTPVLQHYGILVRRGTVAGAQATLEYAPEAKWVQVSRAELRGIEGDYRMAAEKQKQDIKATAKAASKKKEGEELEVRIDQLKVLDGIVGFHNTTTHPDYRLFVSGLSVDVQNYSNGFRNGPAVVRLQGKFMGKGSMVVRGQFRPDRQGPDFNLNVAIEDTPMPDLNGLFQAYGKLDVAAGSFSFYSEMTVQNGRMQGYVKPLFQDVQVYSAEQEKNKDVFHKIYEGAAGAMAKIFENRSRQEVATKTEVSGPLENPKADTWEAITFLVRNAFVKNILPGFEQAYAPGAKPRGKS